MGNIACNSCKSTSVATAKLILQNGELREFTPPVKVSHALRSSPASFICDSDHIDFGELMSAVDNDDELHVGQLYFALPLAYLNRPVRAEDMAALAVKASVALRGTKVGPTTACCGVGKGVEPLVFAIKKDESRCRPWPRMVGPTSPSRYGGVRVRVRKRQFVAKLGGIIEE